MTTVTDWIVCVHEAAHAVVYATAGRKVKRIILRGADGGELKGDTAGGCELEPLGYVAPCGWNTQAQTHWSGVHKWAEMLGASADRGAMLHAERAEICGLFAGPLSEMRLSGNEDGPLPTTPPGIGDDLTLAAAHAGLLGDVDEIASDLATQTMELLKEQETWGKVQALALALQERRALSGSELASYLPKTREGWPR